MNKILTFTIFAVFTICAACGAKTETNSGSNSANKTNPAVTENKTNTTPSSTTSVAAGSPSAVVKEIYDNAIKRNCSAIPPMLVEEFKKEVGTSKEGLEALCDSLTDSGKVSSVEVKSEEIKGDSAVVKTSYTYKDGKKEEKEERMKKAADGKWLMDS